MNLQSLNWREGILLFLFSILMLFLSFPQMIYSKFTGKPKMNQDKE